MGVNGLWALLKPYRRTATLADLAEERFASGEEGRRQLKKGIDASMWLIDAQKTAESDSAEALEILLHMTLSLLSLPILAVFVFDGPHRPSQKRGRHISGYCLRLERPFRELVKSCGFEEWKAMGEAEVELAAMAMNKLIDLVVTDDGDTLVFGDVHVFRNSLVKDPRPFTSLSCDFASAEHEYYDPSDLDGFLGPSARIFIALFAGGDYAHGAFPDSPSKSHRMGEHQRRAALAADVAVSKVDPRKDDSPTVADALLSGLRRIVEAKAEDQVSLLAQERSDWLPILEQKLAALDDDDEDVDLKALFDLSVIKLYLRPKSCSNAELLHFRPRWEMRPSLPTLSAFVKNHLQPFSKTETRDQRQRRRRQELVRGVVANHLRHDALRDDPWSPPNTMDDSTVGFIAARRCVVAERLEVIVEAGPIVAALDGADDPSSMPMVVRGLSAGLIASLDRNLFERDRWTATKADLPPTPSSAPVKSTVRRPKLKTPATQLVARARAPLGAGRIMTQPKLAFASAPTDHTRKRKTAPASSLKGPGSSASLPIELD